MKGKILNSLGALLWGVPFIGLFISLSPLKKNIDESPEIWLIHQDFFSFGKRDVYEAMKKMWLAEIREVSDPEETLPTLAIQSRTNPEYIYLTPLGSFGALDIYAKNMQRVIEKSGRDVEKSREEAWFHALNFQIMSLHRYLPLCSCLPKESNVSLAYHPYVHYFVISITPGQSTYFENFLKRQVTEHNNQEDTVCWRVWRVLIGADVPKYVIGIFSRTEEELKKEREKLDLGDPSMLGIVRREREGWGVLRTDLSILP